MKGLYHRVVRRTGTILLLCLLIIFQGSCSYQPNFLAFRDAKSPPRIRMSCYASSTVGTTFADPEHLGLHGYSYGGSEKTGIVYTCKAGHIDIAHLRKAADWTAFLAEKTLEQLRKNRTAFSFKLYEPSRYFVKISYPQKWKDLSYAEKEIISRHLSIRLGQYFAYVGCTWHEILTWFGYRSIGFYPEFPSAFSWEDSFSNLLGTHIASMALRDAGHEYDESMTIALYRELKKLDVQPRRTAIRAAEDVKGLWYSGDFLFLVEMKGRNFDIGLDDGYVTPLIVPSASECEGIVAQPYPVPNLDLLSKYGFSVKLEIEPREWEKDKILKVVYPGSKKIEKRLEPAIHFARIMDYIKEDAAKRYGRDVNDDN